MTFLYSSSRVVLGVLHCLCLQLNELNHNFQRTNDTTWRLTDFEIWVKTQNCSGLDNETVLLLNEIVLNSFFFSPSLRSFLEYDIYRDTHTKCSFFCWSFSAAEQTKSVMKCSSVNSFSAPFCTLLGFLFAFLQSFFHHSVAPHLTAVAAFVYICIKSKDISL